MTHCVTQQQPIDLNTSGIDKVNRASLEMQTSPNPCNKGTQVKLNLNNFQRFGQVIDIPLSGVRNEGKHAVHLTTELLDNGIYYINLSSEGRTLETIKILINH
jgi:hypothetical protein